MKKFFLPLGIFVLGNLALLVFLLFLPSIGSAGTQLETDSAAMASTFWGWSWAVGGVKLFAILIFEGLILWGTGKAFLKSR